VRTNVAIEGHGYRAGPFVIDAADGEAAIPVIQAWQAGHITTVHEATRSFETDVAQTLVNAPTIAMFADGNEDIARRYMLAAGIPDSTGDLSWPDDSPDMLSIEEIAGPTDANHRDGALFDDNGVATYCQLMSMHWRVGDAEDNPEVVAEVRQFLRYPTHFFAECQAVNAFENNVNGRFLTPFGFEIDNIRARDPVDFYNADSPFAQIDQVYEIVGGSERSYTPCGNEQCTEPGEYLAGGVVMITEQGTPAGVRDVWMTGFLDGNCGPDTKICEDEGDLLGKISYLGGHEYRTDVPLSENPRSGGTRLFLQSLLEAPCATLQGQPVIDLEKTGATLTTDGSVTYTLAYENTGGSVALDVTITDALPEGATFVSATRGGVEANGVVTWTIGNVAPLVSGTVEVTVTLDGIGETFENVAEVTWRAGVSERRARSNTTTTLYDNDQDGDGVGDSADNCPENPNPGQDLDTDPNNCGTCGNVCPGGTCVDGECVETGDDTGVLDAGGDGGDADAGDTGGDDSGDPGPGDDDDTRGGVDAGSDTSGGDAGPGSVGGAAPSGCSCDLVGTPARAPWLALLLIGLLVRRGTGRETPLPG
jgi:uncharacterized repeat protein (TIGR01451 family)